MTISATTKFIRQGLELDRYDGALAGDIVNQGDKGLLVDFGGNKLRLLGDFDYRNGEATGTIDTIRLEIPEHDRRCGRPSPCLHDPRAWL